MAIQGSDQIDWPGIEREFRLGQLRLAEIAAGFGIGEAAIRRRARQEGWTRGGEASDRVAVLRGIEVVREHRHMLAELRETLGLVQRSLRDHLTQADSDAGPFGAGAETVAGLVRALGTTAERLIRLERGAFGLDRLQDKAGDDDSSAEAIREQLAGRLARLAEPGGADALPERIDGTRSGLPAA